MYTNLEFFIVNKIIFGKFVTMYQFEVFRDINSIFFLRTKNPDYMT